jgi:hypothetical protein
MTLSSLAAVYDRRLYSTDLDAGKIKPTVIDRRYRKVATSM